MKTNLHVHTPHSFSYFDSVSSLVAAAKGKNIGVLGINDFYTAEGFEEFTACCLREGIYPVYGLEVMVIEQGDKEKGILWNDPHNPGRVYLCGKGLCYPPQIDEQVSLLIKRVKTFSQGRIKKMIEKANACLSRQELSVSISYRQLRDKTPSGWVRERHIAQAIEERLKETEKGKAYLKDIFSGEGTNLTERIRSRLLKARGVAYIEEDNSAFLSLEEAKRVFLGMGGIPTYPVLADGAEALTHIEEDPYRLGETLKEKGFTAVEFIPHRNSAGLLGRFVKALRELGFVITAGTEHNNTAGGPLAPAPRDCKDFESEIREIFWEGCCIIVAHQCLRSEGEEGLVDMQGKRTSKTLETLRKRGEDELRRFSSFHR